MKNVWRTDDTVASVPSDEDTLEQYRRGVDAVGAHIAGWSEDDWTRPACGTWTATDLAGHLVTVIRWYHAWLDRGLAGITEPAFPITALDTETGRALRALPDGTGPDRIALFTASADDYAERLIVHWDAPFAYPRGPVTAGLHAGVAAVEWHVHAWDFATSAGRSYTPEDADTLFLAAARCRLAVLGGTREKVGLRVARVAARQNPWEKLLRRMGRV
jgi:uncharacterized protein (TIGR03083 family)